MEKALKRMREITESSGFEAERGGGETRIAAPTHTTRARGGRARRLRYCSRGAGGE